MTGTHPLSSVGAAWLWRGRGSAHLAAPCRVPDCSKLVPRSPGAGRPAEFCKESHRKKFARQKESLTQLAADLEAAIEASSTGMERRALAADLGWISRVLRAYQ